MATRNFSSLLYKVSPSVPGCPQPLMLQAIRDAAIRTCERTLAWRHAQAPATLLPGVYEYAYDKPANTDVHAVLAVRVNNSPLEVLTLEQALVKYPAWAELYSGLDPAQVWEAQTAGVNASPFNEEEFNGGDAVALPEGALEQASEPRAFTQVTPDRYVVLPLPDDAQEYRLRAFYALKPTRSATGMGQTALDELEDTIVHNALQHLLVMPGVSWTDRELASYHAKQYIATATERRARANLGNMRGTLRATAPRFA